MPLVRKPSSPFWWYDFCFEGRRYRGSTKKKTKAAAQTVEAAVLTKLTEGIQPAPKTLRAPNLREFSKRFLAWAQNTRTLRPNTRKYYEYGWRLLSFSALAPMHIDQISTEIVDCTLFMRPVVNRKTGETTDVLIPCSPSYTNQALRTLKAMIGMAVEWKVLATRPRFSTLAAPGREQLIDQDAEIRLQAQFQLPTKQKRHNRMRQQAWLFLAILQDTGMRPNELYPLKIEDLHWETDRIWIAQGKTKNARRFVSMSERVKWMLKDWTKGRSGWVFPSKRSASGHLESISSGFRAARKRAKLDPAIVPYSARHTFGTFQMQATGNVFAVSKSMGHAGVASMTPYQHPDTAQLKTAIDQRNREREVARFNMLAESSHTFSHTTDTIQ